MDNKMNTTTEKMILYDGAPSHEGRYDKEMAVYRLLSQLDIPFKRVDHEPMMTVDACRDIDQILNIEICKNLFLCNSQKTKFFLVMLPGDKRFDTKTFCKQISSPRLSFASEEYMLKYLNITPGSVSVMGLMNDKDNVVSLYIDKDVFVKEELGCHPCINTSSLKMKTKDLIDKFLPAIGHSYTIVEL
ncbi:MAG TPA: prolyl-tRNA synthetase associated domain-containing protein [Lachnospiraceae bacterium]|nr:prolyl-tRNA synthetase associated domain-containing protein [Lachnospiraceae bacterium]